MNVMSTPPSGVPCRELRQFLGDRIRIARKAKGFTQERLALLMGAKHGSFINRFECGERSPSINQLLAMQELIDLDLIKVFSDLTQSANNPAENDLKIERELLLHIIRRKANEVEDPITRQIIVSSIHLLDGDSLKSLFDDLQRLEVSPLENARR